MQGGQPLPVTVEWMDVGCDHFWGCCRRDPSERPSKNASNSKHLRFSATTSHSLHFQQQLFRAPGLPHIFPLLYLEPTESHPTKGCIGFLEDSLGLGSCRSNNNSSIHRTWAMCQAWKYVCAIYIFFTYSNGLITTL